ncbi:restriction endonuclease subunit S [Vibrio parahaemolyticus]|nr:restriction endonuclease subunit S [Vibrio alginolyticus]EJT3519290.1 restriction endonuclease subunit S [Vibrio parahaemolyticus]MDF4287985.1 restriction endonuclease subunit S [Vibrio parahaemolyticus]MDF4302022.1 restriction endonuclease subunit S [Vibrio parahaemolyticus]MDF5288446.1 restriction endonuclease subunit S [Vibrio parahaemolyticus]
MRKSHLPEGWCISRISDISMKGEQRKPSDEETFIYVDIGSINRDLKCIESPLHLIGKDAPSRARKVIRSGDVLVSLTRPNLNAVALVPCHLDNQIASTGFEVIKTLMVDSRYVFALTRSKDFIDSISGVVQGALYPAAKSSDVQAYTFCLPPLAEQKVIADKLDTLLAQVETIKARLVRIPENLKTFRQSVLAAAVSGRLNSNDSNFRSIEVKENWAHEVEGRTHWKEYIFSDVIKIIGGSQPPKSEFSTEERDGYIRLIQIRDYKSDAHKVYIPIEKAKRFVSKEDIMIGRYGPPIFQILRGLEGAYNVALMKAEPNAEILDKEYLYWYLQNYKLFNYIDAGSDRTAGQTGVNKKYLESYPILVPPLDEQIEISRRVKELFVLADSIEQKAKVALDSVNNLTQSFLAKAFRGELTADWRAANLDLVSGDNSAEALLEKIKSEREVTPKPKRTAAKKKSGNRMNKKIIKVVEALKEAKKPLNGQELLAAAGYPKDSSTEQLEQFFLDIRKALNTDKSIIKLERSDDGQDWFALAESAASE